MNKNSGQRKTKIYIFSLHPHILSITALSTHIHAIPNCFRYSRSAWFCLYFFLKRKFSFSPQHIHTSTYSPDQPQGSIPWSLRAAFNLLLVPLSLGAICCKVLTERHDQTSGSLKEQIFRLSNQTGYNPKQCSMISNHSVAAEERRFLLPKRTVIILQRQNPETSCRTTITVANVLLP